MSGRYPGYDVLAKRDTPSFNAQTRDVVDRRIQAVPERRFLAADEWALVEAIAARLVPQPDRAEPVPITPWVDAKLADRKGEGFRHDGMPRVADAWRLPASRRPPSDEGKDYHGAFAFMSQGPLPVAWAQKLATSRGLWGEALRRDNPSLTIRALAVRIGDRTAALAQRGEL